VSEKQQWRMTCVDSNMSRKVLCLLALAITVDAAQKPSANARDNTVANNADEPAEKTTGKPVRSSPMPFIATAYSTKGNTVKGVQTQPGIVAADRKILPLGSTIRVTDAGQYSGLYVVTDVGTAIVGNRIDIFVAELEDARAFGKKTVQVELMKPGDDIKFKPETTNVIPKSALAPAQKEDAAAIPGNKVPASKCVFRSKWATDSAEKWATDSGN
jgi:3D (Asp-Asp-Asp) domain-containing protein